MKKFLIITLCALFFAPTIYAQQKEKRAAEIVKALADKTKSYDRLSADFSYSLYNKEADINETKKGKLWVEGDKYRLEIAGQIVVCDGEQVYTIMPDAEEVQINVLEEGEDAMTPNKLLSSYYEDYRAKLLRENFENDIMVQVVDLIPNEGKSYFKVRLTIDKALQQLVSIAIYDKNGSVYTYAIDDFKGNPDFDPALLSFKESDYPDFEVIDMR